MKTFAIIILAASVCGILFSFKSFGSKIKTEDGIQFFHGTWAEALQKAKQEKKLIFLDAYASWCGPCKMMKHKTFTNKNVADFYNANFINLAIDMEIGEGTTLSDKFSVTAYPTLIYVNGEGNLLEKQLATMRLKTFCK
jgi:thiol:disulfide interchange protein